MSAFPRKRLERCVAANNAMAGSSREARLLDHCVGRARAENRYGQAGAFAMTRNIERFSDVQKGLCGFGSARSRSNLLKGKLDSAAHTFCRKHEINRASEFVGNEITYEIDAVAGLDLRCHRGAAKLAPD